MLIHTLRQTHTHTYITRTKTDRQTGERCGRRPVVSKYTKSHHSASDAVAVSNTLCQLPPCVTSYINCSLSLTSAYNVTLTHADLTESMQRERRMHVDEIQSR